MLRENVKIELYSIISEFYGIDVIKEDDTLVRKLGLNSLDILELLMQLNNNLKTDVPDDESIKCTTIGEIIDLYTSYAEKR